jgi:hypothetical protein
MDWEYCNVKECFYYTPLFEYGNCLLRVDRPHTLQEIGNVIGVSKERVRQLLETLIARCRAELNAD